MLEEFDEYLDLQCGRSAHTRRAYLGDLGSLFAFLAERGAGLDALSLPLLRAWLAASAGAGGAPPPVFPSPPGGQAFPPRGGPRRPLGTHPPAPPRGRPT